MKKLLFAVLVIFSFSACEDFFDKEITIKGKEEASYLVVTALFDKISEKSEIHVGESFSLFKPVKEDWSDKGIAVSLEGPSLSLNFDFRSPRDTFRTSTDTFFVQGTLKPNFVLNQPIDFQENEIYQIQATKDGLQPAYAKVSVPNYVEPSGFNLKEDAGIDQDGNKTSTLTFNINDPGGQKNFYKATMEIERWRNGKKREAQPYHLRIVDPEQRRSAHYYGILLNDETFDGEQKEVTLYLRRTYVSSFNDSTVLKLNWITISEDQYEFEKRLQLNMDRDDNPFTSPIPLNTNITNGRGIFAIQNKRTYDIAK